MTTKRMLAVLVVACAWAAGAARADEVPAAARSLADAERAFAAMSLTDGMKAAFLANLADDAIVFNPGPSNGPEVYRARPASPVVLSWGPEHVELSASQDYGFSTGPWEFRRDKDSDPVVFGHFVSVWKQQPGGNWKVALDVGINHERVDAPSTVSFHAAAGPAVAPLAPDARSVAQDALVAADRAFADAARAGTAQAFATYAADDVRLYRSGSVPVVGRDAVLAALAGTAPGEMAPAQADVAPGGDLGFTIGLNAAGSGNYYVRLWRRGDAGWRVILDLETPASFE
ncbi:MAG TPA: nuclear transport factor 2 family protein [Candidatus Krumholzibacteria bacterium]|nr:nuclear transport factor 2 family protein [Candidatus Krumholzibacteria bacterium]